ncbi:hypothetical protein COY07_04610 [Candidatus Peregrinibacteria bacterium CG_4_10_14_0_2_um_filter_43_11]|nr:MAG: hypothetical protein COY07_04610 [Candidatus Peregrinibacteria bacterium CG_4_10_14_0_2_um_filter_43_11]
MNIINCLLNLLFPPRCVSCKTEGDFLCSQCIQKFQKQKIRSHSASKLHQISEFQHLDGVIYALDYAKNPQIKAALQQFKYRFTQELVDYFGDLIAEKLEECQMIRGRGIVLIPVPLHPKRLRYRGFNQAEVIARSIQEKTPQKIEIIETLIRTRHTSQQAKLGKKERHENLSDAFNMNLKLPQKYDSNQVHFIVDDVCTTGSTLENCAKVLKFNGYKRVYGLVVARAFK